MIRSALLAVGTHSGSGDRGSRTKLLPLLIILTARTSITQARSTHTRPTRGPEVASISLPPLTINPN